MTISRDKGNIILLIGAFEDEMELQALKKDLGQSETEDVFEGK